MNKLILAILSLTFSVFASAEYTVRVPLEQANGGTLPNGSIKFKTTATEPEAPVNPLDSYFSNTLNATIDYYHNAFGNTMARTDNKSNISSAAHQDLTIRITHKGSIISYFTVLIDCGNCSAEVPPSFNVSIGGNTYVGSMCSISYSPYNELYTLSDYTSINCRVDGVNGLVLNGTPYSITFN